MFLYHAKESMEKSIMHLEDELSKVRAGRANPSMLGEIKVDFYGTHSPLTQVSSVSAPDARTLMIKPWDKSMLQVIEKAILAANIGLTPMNDGEVIRLSIPMLTEERRRQLVKQVSHECEQGKVSVRSIRKETNESLKKIKGDSEDDLKNAEATVQTLTDEFILKIDALLRKKEAEIMTV